MKPSLEIQSGEMSDKCDVVRARMRVCACMRVQRSWKFKKRVCAAGLSVRLPFSLRASWLSQVICAAEGKEKKLSDDKKKSGKEFRLTEG